MICNVCGKDARAVVQCRAGMYHPDALGPRDQAIQQQAQPPVDPNADLADDINARLDAATAGHAAGVAAATALGRIDVPEVSGLDLAASGVALAKVGLAIAMEAAGGLARGFLEGGIGAAAQERGRAWSDAAARWIRGR